MRRKPQHNGAIQKSISDERETTTTESRCTIDATLRGTNSADKTTTTTTTIILSRGGLPLPTKNYQRTKRNDSNRKREKYKTRKAKRWQNETKAKTTVADGDARACPRKCRLSGDRLLLPSPEAPPSVFVCFLVASFARLCDPAVASIVGD